MPVNHLVIALGGTGGKCIYGLRQMIYQNWGRTFEPETANVRYLWVDSSSIDLGGLHKSFPVLGGNVDLGMNHKIKITGDLSVNKVLEQPRSYPSIAPWLGESKYYQGMLNVANAAELQGAQVRRLGRVLFAQNIALFRARVTDLITDMRTKARPGLPQQQAVDIHFLCGLAGGTGSGSIVDAVASCRNLYPAGNVRIFIYAMMPEEHPRAGRAGHNYKANGYAALRELNALSVGAWRPHNLADSRGERFPLLQDPFTSCFLFSEQSPQRQLEVDKELPQTVASLLYQFIVESPRLQWTGNNTWQTQLSFQVAGNAQRPEMTPGENPKPVRSRRFMSFGIKTISFPQVEIKEHLTYTYCQSAARQVLYNNWLPELGYQETAIGRGFSVTVRTPEFRTAAKLTDAHLMLEIPILLEEANLRPPWLPSTEYWETVAAPFQRNALELTFPAQMQRLHEQFRTAYDDQYRRQGVVKFYNLMRAQSMRLHAEEIRRCVESFVKVKWSQGDYGLYDAEAFVKEVISALAEWRADHTKGKGEKESGRRQAEIKNTSDQNDLRYSKCGIAARIVGTPAALVTANCLLEKEKRELHTQAEGHFYAGDLIPVVENQLQRLLGEITQARTELFGALQEFTVGRDARCLDEDANRNDQQVVKYYQPEEARKVAKDLSVDEQEQRRQSALIRSRLEFLLKPSWTFGTWATISREDIIKVFEDVSEDSAVQGHDALMAREQGRRPVLQANILTELQQRLGGNDEALTNFAIEALAGAQTLLPLDSSEERAQTNPGEAQAADDPRNGVGYTSTVIVLPPAPDAAFGGRIENKLRTNIPPRPLESVDVVANTARTNEITIARITSVMPARFAARTKLLKTDYDDLLRNDNGMKLTELHLESSIDLLPDLYAPVYSADAMLPWLLLARVIPIGADDRGVINMIDARTNPDTGREQFYHWGVDEYKSLHVVRAFGATEQDLLDRATIQDLEDLKSAIRKQLDNTYRHLNDREALFSSFLAEYGRRTQGLAPNDERVARMKAVREYIVKLLEVEVKATNAQTQL